MFTELMGYLFKTINQMNFKSSFGFYLSIKYNVRVGIIDSGIYHAHPEFAKFLDETGQA